jgi:hypothetical protein
MSEPVRPVVHSCCCPDCQHLPHGRIAEEHRLINQLVATFDEKSRRLYVAFLARQQGRGGAARLARIIGLSRNTIRRGQRELLQPSPDSDGRIRHKGGGRKRLEMKDAALLAALERLMQDATAGDPMTELKWTHKSLRKLCRALRRQGFRIGRDTLARLLREQNYLLRTNRKCLAGTHHPDRAQQFRYLAQQRRRFLKKGWPVISVDGKKKELVGNFKNPGRSYRHQSHKVLDHDFRRHALGVGIPYGVYDEGRNAGYVRIGTSHETAAFAVATLRRWWLDEGRYRYPKARRWLVEADGGGGNGSRNKAWKVELQGLADEFGMIICVSHYPPGASKWNWIEHRMFSQISENWAGEPLVSYETMLKFIRRTRSITGFHCRANLDMMFYPLKRKITAEEKASVNLKPRKVLPQWNYVIRPHRVPDRVLEK